MNEHGFRVSMLDWRAYSRCMGWEDVQDIADRGIWWCACEEQHAPNIVKCRRCRSRRPKYASRAATRIGQQKAWARQHRGLV